MSRLRRLFAEQRTQATFVTLMAVGSAIGLFKNLALAPIVGARELGYYGVVLLVAQFGHYAATWGIINALNVELPLGLGRGEEGLDALTNRVFGAQAIPALTMTGIYVLAVVLASPSDRNTEVALLLAAVPVLLTCAFEFYLVVLRARRMLIPLASLFVGRAVLAIGLGLPFGALWGFRGVVAADVVASSLIVAACALVFLPGVRIWRPRAEEFRHFVRVGFPLIVSAAMITVSIMIDRMFVATTLPGQFGQYTFASLVVATGIVTTGIFKQMVYPKLLFDYGAGMGLPQLRRALRRMVAGIVVVGAAGTVALYLLTHVLEHGLFSEYGPGLRLMPILFAGAAISVVGLYEVILLATRRYYLATGSALVGGVVALAGGFAISLQGPTLTKFAWLFTISQAAGTLSIVLASEWAYRRGDREAPRPAGGRVAEHAALR
ncbi:MAG TPA: hypothetical protein VF533_04545 [Solirubrobacteraceae bacterium]